MIEFLLTIFYFLIFCFIISKTTLFRDNQIPRKWFISVFGIKVIMSIAITLLYTYYYTDRKTADIFKYFDDGLIMYSALESHPIDYLKMLLGLDFNTAYFNSNYYNKMGFWIKGYEDGFFSDSHIIIRFNAFVRLFSFGHFQVHNIFINFISLVGLTAIFKTFKKFSAKKEKSLFLVIFFVPSVLLWGSGLLKEGIVLFALGLLLSTFFKFFEGYKPRYLIYLVIAIVLIMFTKFYLLGVIFIPILGYTINEYFKLKKVLLGYAISYLSFLIGINMLPLINSSLNFVNKTALKQQSFTRLINSVETNSGFQIPELTDGISLFINLPNALVNTLIRPFPWEISSFFVLLSAIENMILIGIVFLTIYFRANVTTSQKNIIYFNLSFVFILFSIIGLTVPIFGAIVRYKIPGLILLLIALVLLIDLEKIKEKVPFLKKIL